MPAGTAPAIERGDRLTMTARFSEALNFDVGALQTRLYQSAAGRPHEGILIALADHALGRLRESWPRTKDRGFANVIVEPGGPYPVAVLADVYYSVTGRILARLTAFFRTMYEGKTTCSWDESDRQIIEAAIDAEIRLAGCPAAIGAAYKALLLSELMTRGIPQTAIPQTFWPTPPRPLFAAISPQEIGLALRPILADAERTAANLLARIYSE
jgi:hypothetical protein